VFTVGIVNSRLESRTKGGVKLILVVQDDEKKLQGKGKVKGLQEGCG